MIKKYNGRTFYSNIVKVHFSPLEGMTLTKSERDRKAARINFFRTLSAKITTAKLRAKLKREEKKERGPRSFDDPSPDGHLTR